MHFVEDAKEVSLAGRGNKCGVLIRRRNQTRLTDLPQDQPNNDVKPKYNA